MIDSAADTYDISSLFTRMAGYMRYTECEDYSPLLWHFDLLPDKEYYIVESGGEKYVLFHNTYEAFKERVDSITNVEKQYDGDSLSLTIYREIKKISSGCAPVSSPANYIIRFEKDISSLTVDGEEYTEYDGGYISFKERCGMVDKNLNIVVPIKYDYIQDVVAYDSGNLYYYIKSDEGKGVMDSQYNILVELIYGDVYLVNDDRFAVLKYRRNDAPQNINQIGLVDRNGNLIHEYIEGNLAYSADFNNKPHQTEFARRGDNGKFYSGVIDSDLNIIIEPKYDFFRERQIGSESFGYYVRLENGEQAFFNLDGKQITPFEKGEIIDYYEKYPDRLTAHIW